MDEPFSNLDVRLRHQLRSDTLQLLRDSGTAAILVTHDAEEAMYMADRIALMHAGRIVQMGSPEALYHHPVSPFAAEFFGEVNRLPGQVRQGQVHTPLGPLATTDMPEGMRVDMLVRPESLQLLPESEEGLPARIATRHMLGAITLLELVLQDGTGHTHRLQAQVASDARWQPGSPLRLRLRAEGVFVFAAAPPSHQA